MRGTGRLLAVLLAVALVLPATAAGAAFGGLAQQSVDPDVVLMTADVEADGDAQWRVAYRIRLDDENATQAFEELQADVQANRSAYTDRFGDRMARTARAAENATGRSMTVENVTVTAREETFGQTYGVITYRFRWTNFAVAENGRIEAGDALAGLFLDGETSLTIAWPDGYAAEQVTPQPDDRTNTSATWRGQQQFGTDEPRVVAAQGGGGGLSPVLVGGVVVAVLALAVAAFTARRDGLFGGDGDSEGDTADAATTAAAPDPSPTAEQATGSESAADSTTEADQPPADPPADLLSNEEQVLKLLRENGGRIKQQRVASELDWTAAKTSQVIGGLRDEGELETFRIGRENVVTFPDTDLTETDDPDGEDDAA
ncbi:DUF7345 domain-containing protein [Haloarcula marina]|uniref:DUF7345 domain-containing protein n=1 Tax=Haloarcula marina TaxID=2961574 RepID=UPI0020B861D4|nr:hypothetical protein [Halomicroarcula marina]